MVKNKNNIEIKNVGMNEIYCEALKYFKILRRRKYFSTCYELYRIYHHLNSSMFKTTVYNNLTEDEYWYIVRLTEAYRRRFEEITKTRLIKIEEEQENG